MSQSIRNSLNSEDLRAPSLSRRLEEQQQAAQSSSAAAQQTSGASSNPMSGNFAQRREDSGSKYVQATLDGFKKDSALQTAQRQNTFALVLQAQHYYEDSNGDGELSGAELYLGSLKTERMMVRKYREKAQEAGEEALEEVKSEREKQAREATVPRDADGDPILVGTEAVDAEAAEEIAAPEAAPAPAPEAAPLPEQVQYSAPVTVTGETIDITV